MYQFSSNSNEEGKEEVQNEVNSFVKYVLYLYNFNNL